MLRHTPVHTSRSAHLPTAQNCLDSSYSTRPVFRSLLARSLVLLATRIIAAKTLFFLHHAPKEERKRKEEEGASGDRRWQNAAINWWTQGRYCFAIKTLLRETRWADTTQRCYIRPFLCPSLVSWIVAEVRYSLGQGIFSNTAQVGAELFTPEWTEEGPIDLEKWHMLSYTNDRALGNTQRNALKQ